MGAMYNCSKEKMKNILFALLLTTFLLICNSMTVCFSQTIRYVKPTSTGTGDGSSWANASGNIQTMLNVATSGDQVWIAGGTYLLTATLEMEEGVDVFGGFYGNENNINDRPKHDLNGNGVIESWEFTNATILDGQNTRRVLAQLYEFSVETIWDGVTITKGRITAPNYGAGAYIQENTTLINCIIKENTVLNNSTNTAIGGGIYNNGGAVTYCFISNNTAGTNSGANTNRGGGICNIGGTISHCIINSNTATSADNSRGGGVYNSSGIVINCEVSNNKSTSSTSIVTSAYGGGIYNNGGTITLCEIFSNTVSSYAGSYGGGIYNSEGIVNSCTITNNTSSASAATNCNSYGGGIACSNSTNNIIEDCIIENNKATGNSRYGGGIYQGIVNRCIIRENNASNGGGLYNSTISNCLIESNIASINGGGAYNTSSTNCTFVENTAGSVGGGMYGNSAVNCIFWRNTAPTSAQISTTGTVTYSAIQGGFTGTGNIDIASSNESGANFVNPTEGNYQLQSTSPCINVGYNGAVPNPTIAIDLAGNTRICGDIVDMGAYEAQINCMVSVTNIANVPNTAIIGTPLTLTGTVVPNNATNQIIIWSVSDAGATGATIIGNTFFATTAGIAVITATIINGIAIGTNYTQDFTITVTLSFVAVTDIINLPNVAIVGTPLTLTGTVVPNNATYQTIDWSVVSAGTTEATIISNTFFATAAGTAVIMATIANGVAVGTDYTQGFYIMVNPVSITEPTQKLSNLIAYPNPTVGKMQIGCKNEICQVSTESIAIFDMMGRNVGANFTIIHVENEIQIDISHLHTGVYILRIEGEMIKIVKL
jgi:hypothetical protein